MELAVYIQKYSDEAAAELFGVTKRTIAAWRRMERAPRPVQSMHIIKQTQGKVSWEGIYKPYARYRERQSRKASES
ncbi:hypothetical protein [Endozoicomonas lisbonensis]|uniref:Helix-turn-helix domain-containing protein n=1 Tax=Endozoicomonas lisbonensis TaxID=3120522 RepID=A0ABV2SB00_9GAMM